MLHCFTWGLVLISAALSFSCLPDVVALCCKHPASILLGMMWLAPCTGCTYDSYATGEMKGRERVTATTLILYQQMHSYHIHSIFNSTTTQRRSRHSTDTMSEFHAKSTQATASERLPQGSFVAAGASFKLMTNRPLSHHAPLRVYTPWIGRANSTVV